MTQKQKFAYAVALAAISPILATPLYAADEKADAMSDSTAQNDILTQPPIAEKRDHEFTHHGVTVSDPYHWLKDQSYPTVDDEDVLDYLKAENRWFEQNMAPHKALKDEIFEEIKGRINEDDSSVPQKYGDWVYWTEYQKGQQYKKWLRKPAAGGEANVILDENELAEGKEYFRLAAFSVSPDGTLLAFSYDDDGSERFDAYVKNLETGETLPDVIPGTLSSIEWTANGDGFLYGLANENWRVDNVWLHRLGSEQSDDVLLYKEDDIGFQVGFSLSSNEKYIIIGTGDNETSEVRFVPRDNVTAEQVLVAPRKKGREYEIDMRDDTLYIHTNDDHINFRLATAPIDNPGEWTTLIAGSDEFYLTDVSLFKDFYVTEGRVNGLDQVQIRQYGNPNDMQAIDFPEASYSASLSNNPEWDVDKLRLSYESMITPDTVFDYHLAGKKLETLKVQEIPSGYDPTDYRTERVVITARDGAKVPVSVVYHKDYKKDGTEPLHLYAYGAYGYAVPPGFSVSRLSLVDRGFAYAIAHIRGGDDLGRQWYLDGKLMKRTNTFHDFVDAARGLADMGFTAEGKITASGGSAGGELMGAIVNEAPETWGAVVAHVPFVDVLNTMLDESLPLTPGEWPEWGNPITDKAAFDYIQSYSPYDNVSAQDYPPMLITGGLNDPRVTYWEPAKWTAKLRDTKTDDNILLMKINMGAGHGGKSGRYNAIEETAEEYAFILWQMGMTE